MKPVQPIHEHHHADDGRPLLSIYLGDSAWSAYDIDNLAAMMRRDGYLTEVRDGVLWLEDSVANRVSLTDDERVLLLAGLEEHGVIVHPDSLDAIMSGPVENREPIDFIRKHQDGMALAREPIDFAREHVAHHLEAARRGRPTGGRVARFMLVNDVAIELMLAIESKGLQGCAVAVAEAFNLDPKDVAARLVEGVGDGKHEYLVDLAREPTINEDPWVMQAIQDALARRGLAGLGFGLAAPMVEP